MGRFDKVRKTKQNTMIDMAFISCAYFLPWDPLDCPQFMAAEFPLF